jgi:hypothetical protein
MEPADTLDPKWRYREYSPKIRSPPGPPFNFPGALPGKSLAFCALEPATTSSCSMDPALNLKAK